MHANDLTIDILMRLAGDAMLMFYSCAEHFYFEACQGSAMVVSGEPVADLNYIMLNSGDSAALAAFGRYVGWCDERELPFACMVAPDAGEAAARAAAQRWKREGRRVRVAHPPRGCDFNDVLLGRVSELREAA